MAQDGGAIDWCAVDPDGATQGLGRLHGPRSAEIQLRAALNYHAAAMAPALAKHWRKLQRMREYKLQFNIGWSLNEPAKNEPGTAATYSAVCRQGCAKGLTIGYSTGWIAR